MYIVMFDSTIHGASTAVARGPLHALGRRLRRFMSSQSGIRSPYARVRVKVAFHGFWPGFRLGSFLAFRIRLPG